MSSFKDLHLLSTIDREISVLDPDITPRKTFSELVYARSTLSELDTPQKNFPHLEFMQKLAKGSQQWMQTLGESLARLIPEPALPKEKRLPFSFHAFPSHPRFAFSFQPPLYFSKGKDESNKKVNPQQIPYLIEENTEPPSKYNASAIKTYIRDFLPLKGKLCQNRKGFVYLEIDDKYLVDLLPFIPNRRAKPAPYLGIYSKPDCAHIPVILASERELHNLGEIAEIEEEVSFEIAGLYSVTPNWPGVEQVWYLTIKAPRLEEIRENYRLSPHIGGHPFHIAIGIIPADKKKGGKLPTMRINRAFLAA